MKYGVCLLCLLFVSRHLSLSCTICTCLHLNGSLIITFAYIHIPVFLLSCLPFLCQESRYLKSLSCYISKPSLLPLLCTCRLPSSISVLVHPIKTKSKTKFHSGLLLACLATVFL